jgi:hypothetical protein
MKNPISKSFAFSVNYSQNSKNFFVNLFDKEDQMSITFSSKNSIIYIYHYKLNLNYNFFLENYERYCFFV